MTWRNLVLGDSLELLIDNRGKNPPFENSGVPAISGMTVKPGRIDVSEARRVSEETWKQWMPEPTRRDDVVLTSEAPLGRVALIRDDSPVLIAQRVFCLRGRSGVLDSKFLYYAFQTNAVQADLSGRASGTTVLGIRQPELRKVVISAPEVTEQRAIAEVLGALDDKIAANIKASNLSRSLSVALFQRATSISGYSVTIRDVCSLISRGIAPKYQDYGLLVLNQKCVRDRSIKLEQARNTRPLANKRERILLKNDVLVNSTGQGTLGRIARWTRELEATVDSHITIVRFDNSEVDPVCAGFALTLLEKQVESLAEGSTGQTELRRELLASMKIRVPNRQSQLALGEELDTFDAMELGFAEENRILAKTRDQLLPLLMSGKLRVKDAEKKVEAIV